MGTGDWGLGTGNWELGTKLFVDIQCLMPNTSATLSTSAQCPITLNPLQWICDVSLEIDMPAEWLRRSFHCL
ncbi:MAG: hypothetical protein V7K50_13665 [Nostoc sp.]